MTPAENTPTRDRWRKRPALCKASTLLYDHGRQCPLLLA